MWIVYLAATAVCFGISFYMYRFVRRIAVTAGLDSEKKRVKIPLMLAGLALGLSCLNISSVITVVILHLFFLALIFQLVNFIFKKAFSKRYSDGFFLWKKVYGLGVIPIFLTAGMLIFGYINMNNVVSTEYSVKTDKNIRAEGYKIALIADVHYGISLDYDELYEKCREIDAQNPDIVVLCGDIVDNSTTKEGLNELFGALGSIRSNFGTFYVFGNHDRPTKLLSANFNENDLVSAITSNGITILQDAVYEINGELTLVGREDRSASRQKERASLESLLSSVDRGSYILTLDHQPCEYEENSRSGVDLILSGHTHAGQFFPVNLLQQIIKFNDAVYGHYFVGENTQAIVTSGFAGWGYPMKTVANSEYVIINIQSK